MKRLKNIFIRYSFLQNRYFIASVSLLVWIMFFDRNSLLRQYGDREDLYQLKKEKLYYQDEIQQTKKDLNELLTDKASLEKFAREKYLMKKDNEEIWLVLEEPVSE